MVEIASFALSSLSDHIVSQVYDNYKQCICLLFTIIFCYPLYILINVIYNENTGGSSVIFAKRRFTVTVQSVCAGAVGQRHTSSTDRIGAENVLKWIFARSYESTESLRPAKDRRDLFMNLLSLYYFVELAKELHVTNTAQKLYISQQNLSQHIQRLEQYYGVPLFHRKPKLALTYAGEQLYAVAVKILAEEHEFQNRLADISEKSIGNLKLGIPTYRGQICLPEILPRFYAKWPNIKIELCNESSNKMEERLYNGELDIFIGVMYQDNPKLESSTLLTDHIYLVCSDELLQRHYPDSWQTLKEESLSGVELAHFSKIPFLLPASSMKLRKTLDQCFLDAKVKPNIFLESQTTELFMSLYPHNYGAFFCTQMRLPTLLAAHPDANAFPLALKKSLINHRLVLAYHKERFLPEYAHDFIEITKDVFDGIAKVRPH